MTRNGTPVEPLRGKYEMEDGAVRCRDQRKNGESEGWCAEDKGLHTGKRKRGVPEDMRGQPCQEGESRDEAVTRATEDNDDTRNEPTGGERGMKGVDTRCSW